MNYFAVEGRLYQWDTGRKVTLTLPYDEYASVVEFSVNNEAEALVVSVVDNVAKIPNILLQRSGSLRLWAVTIEENGRQTRRYGNLPIFPRAKPDDYVYTETEIMDYRKVAEDLAAVAEDLQTAKAELQEDVAAVAAIADAKLDKQQPVADAGKLLYIDANGEIRPLTLGKGLEIVDGVLRVTAAAAYDVEFVADEDGGVMLAGVEFVAQDDGSVMLDGAVLTAQADGSILINGGD